MRRTRLAGIAAVAVLLGSLLSHVPVAVAERTLALSSGSFSFEVDGGQAETGEVVVINDGDEPIKVLVYAADQEVSETGEINFVVPNRDDPDFVNRTSSWVRLEMPDESKAIGNTPYLELDPGDRVPVAFTFQPPANAAPGDHNVVLFFEMFDLPEDTTGASSQITGRIGSRLQIRVRGDYIERLDIEPFAVPDIRIGNAVPYTFTLRNAGNIDQRLSASVRLLDNDEATVARSDAMTSTVVFADTNKQSSGTLTADAQPLGPHTVRLEVTQVDEDGVPLGTVPLTEDRTVWLVPWWLAIGVLAVVALLIGRLAWWFAVRTAKRRVARDSASAGEDEDVA